MRISDWSSDVCSSDLAVVVENVRYPPIADEVDGSRSPDCRSNVRFSVAPASKPNVRNRPYSRQQIRLRTVLERNILADAGTGSEGSEPMSRLGTQPKSIPALRVEPVFILFLMVSLMDRIHVR